MTTTTATMGFVGMDFVFLVVKMTRDVRLTTDAKKDSVSLTPAKPPPIVKKERPVSLANASIARKIRNVGMVTFAPTTFAEKATAGVQKISLV